MKKTQITDAMLPCSHREAHVTDAAMYEQHTSKASQKNVPRFSSWNNSDGNVTTTIFVSKSSLTLALAEEA